MRPRLNHCQLAVAVFTDMQALHRTLDALLGVGLERGQMCLLAPKPTMLRMLAETPLICNDGSSEGGALPELTEVHDQSGRETVVATSEPVLRALLNAEAAGSQQARPFHGPQRPQLDVRSQLEDGRVALVAQTIKAAQHRAVMRELLATSGTGVTTYQGPFISE